MRNALDRGMEPPEPRRAAGKDPEGVLKLRPLQEGSHVLVEVPDDGAGITVEKVRSKAIGRGLLSAERAAQLPEHELLQLIFLPGFSTALPPPPRLFMSGSMSSSIATSCSTFPTKPVRRCSPASTACLRPMARCSLELRSSRPIHPLVSPSSRAAPATSDPASMSKPQRGRK